MYGLKSIVLAQSTALAMLAAVPAAAAPAVSVNVKGVEVSAQSLSVSDAQSAVEAKVAAVAACFDGSSDAVNATYRVQLDVDAAGKVTAVRSVESSVPASAQSCVDEALKGATTAALAQQDATVTITATLEMKREVEAEAPKQIADPPSGQTTAGSGGGDVGGGAAGAGAAGGGAAGAAGAGATVDPNAANAGDQSVAQASATSNQVTAAAAETAEPTKPYSIDVSFTQSLGQGTFYSQSDSGTETNAGVFVGGGDFTSTPYYSYAVMIRPSYKLHERLTVSARFDFDQQLTTTNRDVGTRPREFFFRDIRVGFSSAELYKEETTGLKLGASVVGYFPTSKLAQSQEWVFATRFNADISRAFEKVGPGTLTLRYNFGYRHNFGPEAATIGQEDSPSINALCPSTGRDSGGECWSSVANPRDTLVNGFNVTYEFLEDFSAQIDLQIFNTFGAQLGDSPLPDRFTGGSQIDPEDVRHSEYATFGANQSDLTQATIELGYSISKNFSAALGVSTYQPVYTADKNGKSLRFPFWDFSSKPDNSSTIYLELAFNY